MKRPRSAIKIDPNAPHSAIYAAARQEYNEQVGSIAAERNTWRMTALGALGVAGIAVAGIAYIGAQNHAVPYVIEVDKLGDPLAIGRANVAAPADPRVIRAQLGRWISNVRTVFTDVAAQRRIITDAYAIMSRNGTAYRAINEYYAANSPFERARTETIGVQVNSVIPLSAGAWQIQWTENHRGRDGSLLPKEDYRGVVTISVNPPADDATILANPIGLFIETIEWQRLDIIGARS